MPIPSNNPDKITYFAETDYRSKRIKFGIRDDDRGKHVYVIGKTGMGKSTLLENLAIQDIQNGEGICFIDPHGGTAETLLSYIPEDRIKDVIYFAPFDQEFPVGLNVMEDMGRDKRPLVVSGLMGAFKKVWVDAWSARMEYILNNAMLALMETPGSTLLGVNRMFADKDYRSMIVANVTDPSVKAFWLDEYAKYSDKFATEATAAIQNKVGQFAANPLIRNLVGQPKSTFDIRKVMDERKILIVNLSKGRMGEGNANLVGSMLITKIYLAAMSRADVGPEAVKSLPPFYLYVDEFQSFANESFADILSEARKYKLSLTIAHQYIEQMSDEVRAAVFGNVGTMISFRVGSYDAEVLEKEFAPAFLAEDIVNLGFAQIYLKLMIKGIGSPPFSAQTLNRPKLPALNYAREVIDASRSQFARPRTEVEDEIRKWHEPVQLPPRDPNAPLPPETKKYAPGLRPSRPPAFVPSPLAMRTFTPSPVVVAPPADSALPVPVVAPVVPTVVAPAPAPAFSASVVSAPPPAMPRPTLTVPKAPYRATSLPPSPAPVSKKTPVAEGVPAVKAPEQRGTGRTIPVQPPVHQPFKQVFSAIKTETPAKESGASQPKFVPSGGPKRTEENLSMPLSVLKSQPKKDKGPSEENLSSLKEALMATMASQKRKEVRTEVHEAVGEKKQEEAAAAPLGTPVVSTFMPTAQKTVFTEKRNELLEEVPSSVPSREIPEHVLRGLLED